MAMRLLPLLMLAVLNSACGAMLQYAYGYDEEVTRESTRTKRVRLENVPADATVERREGGRVTPLGAAREDLVTYAVSETVAIPRSRAPMYVGAAIDAVAGGALIAFAAKSDQDDRVTPAYAAGYFIAGLVADLVFASIYPSDAPPEVLRYAPLDAPPVTYVARGPAGVFEQPVHVAWSDRVVFDETPSAGAPGGPRIELPPPAPLAPPPSVATRPPPKPTERWYGWQILPIDIGAATLVGLGLNEGDRGLVFTGIGVAALAPSLVHLAHGEYERAGGSLGLRVGMPLAGGAVGAAIGAFFGALITNSRGGNYAAEGAFYIGITGAITAGILTPLADDVFLAWEEVEPEPGLTLVPTAAVTAEGKPTFGLAGRF